MDELLTTLRVEFGAVETIPEIYEAALRSLSQSLSPDRCFIAGERNGAWDVLESHPQGWAAAEGLGELLSPVSLPCLAATQRESCLVDDWTDVRSAAAESPSSPDMSVIRSVLSVPFGQHDILVAVSGDVGAFSQQEKERAETISDYATTMLQVIDNVATGRESDEDLEQAATVLSHDANNYLTIIEGRCELARTSPEPDHFDAIDRAVTRLSDLVDDTANLLLAGGQVTETEPIDFDDAVRLSWDVLDSVEAHLELDPVGTIAANWSRVTRLLENLFRNALEHAGRDVTVRVGPLPGANGFYVEDDGTGIAPSGAEDMFAFGWSTTSSHKGFGLNIVEWIAEAHGWDLTVAEAESGGVRFEFSGVEMVDRRV